MKEKIECIKNLLEDLKSKVERALINWGVNGTWEYIITIYDDGNGVGIKIQFAEGDSFLATYESLKAVAESTGADDVFFETEAAESGWVELFYRIAEKEATVNEPRD